MHALLPPDVSSHGWRTDGTLATLALFAALFALVALLGLAVALVRGARRTTPSLPRAGWRSALPAALAVLCLASLELFVARDAAQDLAVRRARPTGPGVLRVQVRATRWAWSARYAGRDGQFDTPDDLLAADALRVARGADVSVQLQATDVIHSFFLPNLRIKQDAVPGRVTRVWFRALREGDYPLVCAELCGPGHGQMTSTLRVLAPQAFARWLEHSARDQARLLEAGAVRTPGAWPWRE